jgi:type I restriction enzyme M protein
LLNVDIERIANTYHAWRGEKEVGNYEEVPGFCKSARVDEIAEHNYALTPGRYVGAEEAEEDGEPFDIKIERFVDLLRKQQAEGSRLDEAINANLKGLGYGE